MLVLGLRAVCAHVGFCGVHRRAFSELCHALCGPRNGSESVFMDEAPACCYLERVDLAAELQVLRALCVRLLDLLLAPRASAC